jgi:hypothetical protein
MYTFQNLPLFTPTGLLERSHGGSCLLNEDLLEVLKRAILTLKQGRLHGEFIGLLFLQSHTETDLAKAAGLRITREPITSRTHTHPSHSETSRLLTSSLSLVVPVPRGTQCMRDV